MATLELVDVPESLIERLTALAVANNHSMSKEVVAALEQWVETTEILARIQSFREQLSVPPLTDRELRRVRREGRS